MSIAAEADCLNPQSPDYTPPPTSQDVADTLSAAFDAVMDVVEMLEREQKRRDPPGSLEHVAYAALAEHVLPPARDFVDRARHYLVHLPEPTAGRRHPVHRWWTTTPDETTPDGR